MTQRCCATTVASDYNTTPKKRLTYFQSQSKNVFLIHQMAKTTPTITGESLFQELAIRAMLVMCLP